MDSLRIRNRLEELRSKHGHEDTWDRIEALTGKSYPEDYEAALARLESKPTGAGKANGGTSEVSDPLPESRQRPRGGGVTPPASPGHSLMDDLEL